MASNLQKKQMEARCKKCWVFFFWQINFLHKHVFATCFFFQRQLIVTEEKIYRYFQPML